MRACLYLAGIVFVGLLSAQAVAFLHVYLSNMDLHRVLSLLETHGYLLVPGPLIAVCLPGLKTAFIGGLFYTFSIGAGLSLLALGLGWCWDRALMRNRGFGVVFVAVWIVLLVMVNGNGFNPIPSLYFLVVPLTTLGLALKSLDGWATGGRGPVKGIHILPVVILAVLWASHMRSPMFLDIRDNHLWPNALGLRFSDAYYRYSLYPARAFKTLDQKTLKTCRIEGFRDPSLAQSVEETLRNHDYLPITGSASVDLTVTEKDGQLVFHSGHKRLLEMSPERFEINPLEVLEVLSSEADVNGFFRQATLCGLLVGFPLVLYVFTHTVIRLILSLFLTGERASILGTGFCFLIGASMLFLLLMGRGAAIEKADVPAGLASERWQDQVSALKATVRMGVDPGSPIVYRRLAASPHLAVRYQLANALAVSRRPETLSLIIGLLEDPSPNVVCRAFRALGRRGNEAHMELIIERIEKSDHWYVQWYAYRALKALGWKQKRSA